MSYWHPPTLDLLAPMLIPIAVGAGWGMWRGQRASVITLAILLALVVASVAIAYSSARGYEGFGIFAFFAAMGLLGPALTKSRMAAAVVAVLIATIFVAGSDIIFVVIACPLWGTCI